MQATTVRSRCHSVGGFAIAIALAMGLFVSVGVADAPWAAADPDAVAAVKAEMDRITEQSQVIEKAYNDSLVSQQAKQVIYDQAKADVGAQAGKVASMKLTLGQIATLNYSNNGVNSVAMLLTSPDDSHFLSDMGTIASVMSIANEKLTRYSVDKDRLVDLENQAAQDLAAVQAEASRQAALLQQSDAKKAEAQALLDRLTAEEAARLRVLQEQTTRQAGALGGGSTSRAGAVDYAALAAGAASTKMWPAQGPITSPFGYRTNPIGGYTEFHDGVDIGASCGAPVVAAWSGVVKFVGGQSGWGNRVEVASANGISTAYNHLQGYSVHVGQSVGAGEVIARVGSTGYSTGCHLHFTVYQNGTQVNPAVVFSK